MAEGLGPLVEARWDSFRGEVRPRLMKDNSQEAVNAHHCSVSPGVETEVAKTDCDAVPLQVLKTCLPTRCDERVRMGQRSWVECGYTRFNLLEGLARSKNYTDWNPNVIEGHRGTGGELEGGNGAKRDLQDTIEQIDNQAAADSVIQVTNVSEVKDLPLRESGPASVRGSRVLPRPRIHRDEAFLQRSVRRSG